MKGNIIVKMNYPKNKKARTITKEIKYFCGIPVFKIKEYENWEIYYLLGLIKIFKICHTENQTIYKISGIRFLFKKDKISKKKMIEINSKYENQELNLIIPKVKTKEETLKELILTEKSITRIGEGEFNLISGEGISFQDFSENLQSRLKKILVSDNKNLLIGIPNIFSSLSEYSNGATCFWRKYIVLNREKIYNIIDFKKQYFDANVSRPYMDLANKDNVGKYFEDFKKIWNNKDVIFVEGEMSRLGVGNNLFDNCKSIKRIICPVKNSFHAYDKILNSCKSFSKDTLFILALGPTATVLAYDLSEFGYRALDLGHIDIEYEWFLRKAKKKSPIKNKYVNEVERGRVITNSTDEKYLSEIIETIV